MPVRPEAIVVLEFLATLRDQWAQPIRSRMPQRIEHPLGRAAPDCGRRHRGPRARPWHRGNEVDRPRWQASRKHATSWRRNRCESTRPGRYGPQEDPSLPVLTQLSPHITQAGTSDAAGSVPQRAVGNTLSVGVGLATQCAHIRTVRSTRIRIQCIPESIPVSDGALTNVL